MIKLDSINEQSLAQNEGDLQWEKEETDLKKQLLKSILRELPEIDRTIVTLYYLMEHSVNEISEITGVSQSNVKVKLHRSRVKIHEELTLRMGLQIAY